MKKVDLNDDFLDMKTTILIFYLHVQAILLIPFQNFVKQPHKRNVNLEKSPPLKDFFAICTTFLRKSNLFAES